MLAAALGERPAEPRAGASRALLARVRVLHGAERLPRTRRSRAAGLAEMQRALRRLHLRAGARERSPVAAECASRTKARRGELARIGIHHLERVEEGIVRSARDAKASRCLRAIDDRARDRDDPRRDRTARSTSTPTAACPKRSRALHRRRPAGGARSSLNSFRPRGLCRVLSADRLRARRRARIDPRWPSTRPARDPQPAHASRRHGRRRRELAAMDAFLASVPVAMMQTRTLNIDPERIFRTVGRPQRPLGMRASDRGAFARRHLRVGNFTHTH